MIAAVRSFTRRRMASRSPYFTWETPARGWPKPSQYFACPVIVTAPIVRPWNELHVETMSVRSRSSRVQWWRRASLRAPSLASVPVLAKKTRSKPVRRQSSAASSICRSL